MSFNEDTYLAEMRRYYEKGMLLQPAVYTDLRIANARCLLSLMPELFCPGLVIVRVSDSERFQIESVIVQPITYWVGRESITYLNMRKLSDGSRCRWLLDDVIDSMTRRKSRRLEDV